MRASYFVTSFELGKINRKEYSKTVPSGEINTMLAPLPYTFEASSMNNFHTGEDYSSSFSE